VIKDVKLKKQKHLCAARNRRHGNLEYEGNLSGRAYALLRSATTVDQSVGWLLALKHDQTEEKVWRKKLTFSFF